MEEEEAIDSFQEGQKNCIKIALGRTNHNSLQLLTSQKGKIRIHGKCDDDLRLLFSISTFGQCL
jgi:hypothetical protein